MGADSTRPEAEERIRGLTERILDRSGAQNVILVGAGGQWQAGIGTLLAPGSDTEARYSVQTGQPSACVELALGNLWRELFPARPFMPSDEQPSDALSDRKDP